MAEARFNIEADSARRTRVYQGLIRRNRVVGVLRLAVPVVGALVLIALIGEIYISSLGTRFGVGRIEVTRDSVSIDTPEYAGVLDNGTAYRVWASQARAAIGDTNRVALTDARLVMRKRDGVTTTITAVASTLDLANETVTIPGVANIVESTGTVGTIVNSVFDYANQKLVGEGPVHVDQADGTTLDSVGMTYDTNTARWTFSRAIVTLPSTPGSKKP
ncbi:MAG: hypothetical protein KKF33_00905 [Alphaproteobacteria bacterium]|nr:hypothetical protein [Alphaproteobacteria bacterium]